MSGRDQAHDPREQQGPEGVGEEEKEEFARIAPVQSIAVLRSRGTGPISLISSTSLPMSTHQSQDYLDALWELQLSSLTGDIPGAGAGAGVTGFCTTGCWHRMRILPQELDKFVADRIRSLIRRNTIEFLVSKLSYNTVCNCLTLLIMHIKCAAC